jgi:hypothetical protein
MSSCTTIDATGRSGPARKDEGGRPALRSKTSTARITVRWASGKLPEHLRLHAPRSPELLEHDVRPLRIVLAKKAQRVEPVRQLVEDEPLPVLGLTTRGGSVCCHDAQRIAAAPASGG